MKNLSTKTKIIIGAGIVFALFIVLLIIFAGASSSNKVVTNVELNNNFSSVVCDVKDEKSVEYDINLFTNNFEFDDEILSKNYTQINIKQKQDINSLGVVFLLRSNREATFNVSLKKNDEVLQTTSVTTKDGTKSRVELLLENPVSFSKDDNFVIAFSNPTDTEFVFDTILFFLDEV